MSKIFKAPFFTLAITLGSLSLFANAQTIGERTSGSSTSGQNDNSVRIIEPKKDVEVAKAAAIDDERFELGGFFGVLAVEDFNANPVSGLSFTYHVSNRFIAQVNRGTSDVDKATAEFDNSFLADEDREFAYTNLIAGYKLLPGRSFLGKQKKFNSDIYLLLGLENVEFARGDKETGIVFGTSYRVVFNDSLTGNLDFRGHRVDRELFEEKTTLNTELVFGLNILF